MRASMQMNEAAKERGSLWLVRQAKEPSQRKPTTNWLYTYHPCCCCCWSWCLLLSKKAAHFCLPFSSPTHCWSSGATLVFCHPALIQFPLCAKLCKTSATTTSTSLFSCQRGSNWYTEVTHWLTHSLEHLLSLPHLPLSCARTNWICIL